MEQAQTMLLNLGIQRQLSGHYQGDIIAADPHRIISTSKRVMSKKQKNPNLNIRYGKLALAMIAQGATYQLRRKMPAPYKNWDAKHLSTDILAWSDGDIRVKDDTIIVTFYGKPNHINESDYIHLPEILKQEKINPEIPWLYDFKLDFRFK